MSSKSRAHQIALPLLLLLLSFAARLAAGMRIYPLPSTTLLSVTNTASTLLIARTAVSTASTSAELSSSTNVATTNVGTTAQPPVTSSAPAQASSAVTTPSSSDPLSVGAVVGMTLGVVIILTTLLATFWTVRRSNRMSEETRLGDLAAVKASELESSRAVSQVEGAHVRPERFGYPVGVGEDTPAPVQEVDSRPYWGRPF